MKTPMIALTFAALGSASAIAVHAVGNYVAQEQAAKNELQMLLQHQPIEQGPGNGPAGVPLGVLPLDATPEPGYVPEPGSNAPLIQLKRDSKVPSVYARPSAFLVLKKSDQLVKVTKDPIWTLELTSTDGKVLESLPALTGRANKQTANRNIAGNKSPLPKGMYAIDRFGIAAAPFSDPELGKGFWVPITPLFNTNRSALGFHQDPSWGKTNGESGTSGCIGLESPQATAKLLEWIKQFNIQRLTVKS